MTGAFKKARRASDAERAAVPVNPLTGKQMNLWRPSGQDLDYMMGIKNGTYAAPGTGAKAGVLQPTEMGLVGTDLKKGATDFEKLNREKKERINSYGGNMVFAPDRYIMEDTTLSSGSLLNLGSKLG